MSTEIQTKSKTTSHIPRKKESSMVLNRIQKPKTITKWYDPVTDDAFHTIQIELMLVSSG